MEKTLSIKEQEDRVKDLCVKTYLEILGYGCLVSARGYAVFPMLFSAGGSLYVDYITNQWRFGTGQPCGGVLEFASLRFGVTKSEILRNIDQYHIDVLLIVRGDRRGSVWTPFSLPGAAPERPIALPAIPKRLASFRIKS